MIKRPLCVLSVIFSLILYLICTFLGGIKEEEYQKDGTYVNVKGEVFDIQKKDFYNKVYIKFGTDFINKMIIYMNKSDVSDIKIGQKIVVRGKYENFSQAENDGQFDLRKYYRIRGYEAALKDAKLVSYTKKYNRIKNYFYKKKEKTEQIYYENMSETEANTLCAMVVGDKSELDTEIKDAYQNAGISHILSQSGLHISTVGMCLFMLLINIGVTTVIASVISGTVMVCYAVMSGMSTSTYRALIMFILLIFARNIGRTYDILSAVSVSSILIMCENPFLVFDSGFLMSFLSVMGIGILYPIFSEMIDCIVIKNEVLASITERVLKSLAISVSASLFTLPVVMNSFYKVSRYSILLNLLVVPLMSLVLFSGISAALIGNILGRLSVFKSVVAILLLISELILRFYTIISNFAGRAYGNLWICGKSSDIQNVVYITLILAACILGAKKRKSFVVVIVTGLICLSVRFMPEYSVNSLSVGQGSCNVIYGKSTPVIIIDGGSSDVKEVGKYRIIPFLYSKGIDKIDYLFITHPDDDHVNGIKELLSQEGDFIKIRHLFLSVYDEEIVSLANDRNIQIHYMKKGDKIENRDLSVNCISPTQISLHNIEMNVSDPDNKVNNTTQTEEGNIQNNNNLESNTVAAKEEDLNDKSLVLKVKYREFTTLFTGDISSEIEKTLEKAEVKCDVLIVPHHGSRFSSSDEFIKNTDVRLAIISAGLNNSYGHPHSETLDRYADFAPNARVFRTDQNGQTSINYKGEKISCQIFKKEKH